MAIEQMIVEMARKAQGASNDLANLSTAAKNSVLSEVARLLMSEKEQIQSENQKDLTAETLADLLTEWLTSRSELLARANKARALAKPDALERITSLCLRAAGVAA